MIENYFVRSVDDVCKKDCFLINSSICYNCKCAKRFLNPETKELYVRCFENPTTEYIVDMFGFCSSFSRAWFNIKSILIEPTKKEEKND